MTLAFIAVIFGLALLVWSADRFVEGSASTARHFGMPPLLIGMVIVGFGTSAPEMVVSALAASQGNPGIALGNAYGAQMLHNMEQEFDVYGGVAHGDLSAVTGWLREKVHQYGHLLEPAEVVRNACGTFDAHYYLDYLTKKYTELYRL